MKYSGAVEMLYKACTLDVRKHTDSNQWNNIMILDFLGVKKKAVAKMSSPNKRESYPNIFQDNGNIIF